MKQFFSNMDIDGVNTYFCSLTKKHCKQAFVELVYMGVTRGIPTIVGCIDGRVLFIVVGECKDRDWWTRLVSGTMGVRGEGTEYVNIYANKKVIGKIQASENLYKKLCLTPLDEAETLNK